MKSYMIGECLAAGAILCGAFCLNAQTPFQAAVDRIVMASPKVQAAEKSATAERLQLQMSNRLADPELDGGYQWGQAGVGDKWEVSITQSFDWPGVYRSRSRSVGLQTDALLSLAAATENDVRTEAAGTLIDYVWACRRVDITGAMLDQMRALEASYDKAFSHGEATILDVNKTRLTCIEASRNHASAQAYLNAVIASVKALAPGIDVDSLLNNVTDFPAQQLFAPDRYHEAAVKQNPALRSLSLSADAARADVSVARRSRIPGFRVGYNHICELGDHFNGVTFGINLPIFSTRHKVAAAMATAEAAELEYSQSRMAEMARTTSMHAQALALAGEIESYQSIADDPRPVKLLKQALDGGEINLLTYLQEIAYFNDANMNYLDLQKEYHSLMVQLNRYVTAE